MARKTNVEINGVKYYKIKRTIGYDKHGKPILKQFYGDSKTDAENKYKDWIKQSTLGIKADSQSLSQAMFTWLWEIEKYSGNKDSTFEKNESIYRNYIENSKIGYTVLSDLNKLKVQTYYNKLYEQGKSYYQIESLNKLFSKFFRYCEGEGYILRNPCKGIKISAYKEVDTEVKDEGTVETFSESEIKKILGACRNEKMKILVKFALGTGLRQGELLALTTDDIEDMSVIVNKRVKRVKIFDTKERFHYETQVSKPKTEKSIRKVPIPSDMESDLKELDIIRKKEKLRAGGAYQKNNLLFPSEVGTYLSARNVIRAWKNIFTRIDVTYKKFHALRHTYATLLLKEGVPLLTVSRLLGHSSIKTTEIYSHVLEEEKKTEVEVLNEILRV